jgi:hypothetical protein
VAGISDSSRWKLITVPEKKGCLSLLVLKETNLLNSFLVVAGEIYRLE